MNKRRLHHVYVKTRAVHPAYFGVLTVASGVVCVLSLRHNNEHMVQLRNNVYAADKAGADVTKPLNALQAYVTTHMNTDLTTGNTSVYPPIQLQYTYARLAQQQLQQATSANTQLYTDAENYCQQQDPTDFSGHNRVPCVEQYVTSHGVSVDLTTQVPTSLYEFDFTSPHWSPDLAGWTMIITALLGLAFLASLVTRWYLRHWTR